MTRHQTFELGNIAHVRGQNEVRMLGCRIPVLCPNRSRTMHPPLPVPSRKRVKDDIVTSLLQGLDAAIGPRSMGA